MRTIAARVRALSREEGGTLSLLNLWIFLFFMILSALAMNAAAASSDKMVAQNGADAVAYSAATVVARSLNATTAANHLSGELNALVVIHHALGGYRLSGEYDPYDRAGEARLASRSAQLQSATQNAYRFVHAVRPRPPENPIRAGGRFRWLDRRPVGGTIRDARDTLRGILAPTYIVHGIGGILQHSRFPPTVALGTAMAVAARILEDVLEPQFAFLDLVEDAAVASEPAKRTIERDVLPLVQAYVWILRQKAPAEAETAGVSMGWENGAKNAALYPCAERIWTGRVLKLPLEQEPVSMGRNDQIVRKSQMVRASWPWVADWRRPIVTTLWAGAPMSMAGRYYGEWSETYTLHKSREFKDRLRPRGLDLCVLADCDVSRREKGLEPWTKAGGSRRADELFCVLGLTRRIPFIVGEGLYERPNKEGVVAYSQAICYNANLQKGPVGGGRQPVVGWDTLNWIGGAPEFPNNGPSPEIRLNWQAKLTPSTRIDEIELRATEGPIGRVIRVMIPGLSLGNTH